jgi:hypothetical protein
MFHNLSYVKHLKHEQTSFKSTTSAKTKAVCDINADRKIGLTGTFLANGAIDIYGQTLAIGIKNQPNKLLFYSYLILNIQNQSCKYPP